MEEGEKMDNNKMSIVEKTLRGIKTGFDELLKQQLTIVYTDAWDRQQIEINHLQDENANLRKQLEQKKEENCQLVSARNSFQHEVEQLKNAGDLYEFVSLGLYPKILHLNNKIQSLRNSPEENKGAIVILDSFYYSLRQMMSKYKMEFFETSIGAPFIENKHEMNQEIPTDNKQKNNTIAQSIMAGIEFKSGKIIREKVNVFKYVPNVISAQNETNVSDRITGKGEREREQYSYANPLLYYAYEGEGGLPAYIITFDNFNHSKIPIEYPINILLLKKGWDGQLKELCKIDICNAWQSSFGLFLELDLVGRELFYRVTDKNAQLSIISNKVRI